MAITIIAGKNTYQVAIATATTGAAGSETPDGSVVYLNPVGWEDMYKSAMKRTVVINGASGYPGLIDNGVVIENCRITADVGANTTAEKNLITNFFYTYGLKQGSAKCFLFIKHLGNAVYEKLSWSSTHTHQQFLKGVVVNFKFSCKDGKLYRIPQLVFGQVTTP